MTVFMSLLLLGVIALIAVTSIIGQRRAPLEEYDTDPDYHTLRSDYQSGMGGGSVRTWKIPKDPEEYAKFFVPRRKP